MVETDVTHSELVRRVQRLEILADAKIVSVDVYTAEKAVHTIEVAGMNKRIEAIEDNIQAATRLLIGAFLTMIGQAVFVVISLFGK